MRAFHGWNDIYTGKEGTFNDYSLQDNFRLRRSVTGKVVKCFETANAGFAKILCKKPDCTGGVNEHFHIICVG